MEAACRLGLIEDETITAHKAQCFAGNSSQRHQHLNRLQCPNLCAQRPAQAWSWLGTSQGQEAAEGKTNKADEDQP